MSKSKLYIFSLLLASFLPFVMGCGSGNNSSSDDLLKSGDYVSLSRSAHNTIIRGKDIFDTVMKKYQPVIDFYGEDSEDFQKLVNTNLLLNAETLVSPSAGLYNYDSLQVWGDAEFVVQYEDGTRETLPAAEMLAINGDSGTEWAKEGKKIAGIYTNLVLAEKVRKLLVNEVKNTVAKIKTENVLVTMTFSLSEVSSDFERLKALTTCFAKISKMAGYIGTAFSVADSIGIIDLGPSSDEIINMKLDYIIDLIQGLYTHMEYIEFRLDEIEDVIVNEANQELRLELGSIMNDINGMVQELENVVSLENKQATALQFRNVINGHLQNYIDYSIADYQNYVEYKINQEHDPYYSPVSVQLQIPLFSIGSPGWLYLTVPYSANLINNPEHYVPFSYEGLDYLKNMVWTRLNINSYIETDPASLNEYNSNIVFTYIGGSGNYIAKLRNMVNQAYIDITSNIESEHETIEESKTFLENFYGTYPPRVVDSHPRLLLLGSQSPVELLKSGADVTIFEDAKSIFDSYYLSKTSNLLEFAASLAAFEIQMAAYLDDEDYEDYKNN